MDFHAMSEQETLSALQSSPNGLPGKEALSRQEKYGPNELTEEQKHSLLSRFAGQFSDFMILILLAAAFVSFLTSLASGKADLTEPVIILGIVVLNAILGVIQEAKAEHSLSVLKSLSAPEATVLRAGTRKLLPAKELVPGDIILLTAGSLVPADARLLSTTQLTMDESSLTGESTAVKKVADLRLHRSIPLADRVNLVFSGTTVLSGHATAIVTATGMNTQVGKIATLIKQDISPETPLKKNLSHTGKVLGIAVILICLFVFLLGILEGRPVLMMFMTAVSLGVAAIPEGLPAIVTIVLSIGVQRMAKKNAIIRHLPAVETLGSATYICSDKTGTLTQNKMRISEISDGRRTLSQTSDSAKAVLLCGALCNNAELGSNAEQGSPTELAILHAAKEAKLTSPAPNVYYKRLAELPFDSIRKCMSTLHVISGRATRPLPVLPEGTYGLLVCKGAPEVVLAKCQSRYENGITTPLTTPLFQELMNYCNSCAKRALRVLAVAYRPLPASVCQKIQKEEALLKTAETELTLLGFICINDPPRPEVKESIRVCREAGITPVMITGDHALTAKAIATELGICTENEQPVTGPELSAMSEKELSDCVAHCRVFARVSPEHKVAIVRALQSRGEVVAMTGDGINDAPALKAADIGCAMGKSGTDVAKEAADMILMDDNFATIVAAVKEGRSIFANIRHCVQFLLSCNIGEIITILFALLFGLPSPLLAIQLLWVNLITDSLPAAALGVEPARHDVMKHPPEQVKKSLFANGVGIKIALEGIMIGFLSLLAYVIGNRFFGTGSTMTFAVLSLSQLVHSLQMRSEQSVFSIGLFTNQKLILSCILCAFLQVSVICFPFAANLFLVTPLTPAAWTVVILLSCLPLPIVEFQKRHTNT